MENYIPISFLNDFVFCPRSVYFHQIYSDFDTSLYHEDIQTKGRIAHLSIDNRRHSTRKNVLQGLPVYSSVWSLCGRVDVFDTRTACLTERKKKIKKLYDGFVFQMYAQCYCLREMGYTVKKLRLHSLDDNKNYPVPLPEDNKEMAKRFKNLLEDIKSFDLEKGFSPEITKCKKCIYRKLCDYSPSSIC